jgi:hypothetical protein
MGGDEQVKHARRSLPLGFAIAVLALLFFAPTAFASKTLVNSFGSSLSGATGGLFNSPRGVAVNESGAGGVPAGTFYVVDSANNRVQRFNSTGGFVRTWGWGVSTGTAQIETCTVAPSCREGIAGAGAGQLNNPRGVAVDQSNGNLYVTDQGNRRVDVFNAAGVFEGAFGWGVKTGSAAFEFCTTFTECRSPNTSAATGGQAGKFGTAIGYPAVDPATGNLYVADVTNRRVDVFTPTLSGGIVTGVSYLRGFGFDVSTAAGTGFEVCTGVDCKQGTGGAGEGQFAGSASPSEVALDSDGNVYALDPGNKRVQKFDSTPAPVSSGFGAAALSAALGIGALQDLTVDPSVSPNHVLVAGINSANENRIAVAELDSSGAAVDVHGAGLTATTSTGLAVAAETLGGNVYLTSSSSNGLFNHFVYVLNAAPTMDPVTTFTGTTATFDGTVVSNNFDTTYHFEYSTDGVNWARAPIPDADAGTAVSTIPVSQEVEGLTGSQPYHVRLVSNRPSGGGSATSTEATFTTVAAAPAISATAAPQVSDTTATLKAELNPQNQATTFHFEYVGDADFQATGYTNAVKTPVDELGPGPGAVAIGRDVSGLQPATTYHFRVVATNSTGTTIGEEGEDRAFTTFPPATTGLPDNRAYELVSLPDTNGFPTQGGVGEANAFGTALTAPSGDSVIYLIAGSLPNTEGNGFIDEYRAVRTGGGWTSRLISPSGAQSEGALPGGVSSDHGYAFWRTGSKDQGSLSLEGGRTSYVRDSGGSYELIGQGSEGVDPRAQGRFITAGADHLIFTSNLKLEPNAPESAGSETDPTNFGEPAVDAVYDRTPDGTTHVASLLPGDSTPPLGSNTFYEGASADGSAVVFLVEATMYERRDNAATLEVATGSPKFAGTSRNGDLVFYLLGGNIFAFDANTEATTPIGSGGESTVVNISADGSHVYFTSPAVLTGAEENDRGEMAEVGVTNLYVWNGETLRFIAILDPTDLFGFDEFNLLGLEYWTASVGPVQNPNIGPQNDPSRTTPDGEVFVFQSHASLTPYDSSGHSEVYRYDAGDRSLVCVSCSPIGAPPSSDADLVVSGFLDAGSPVGAQALIPNVTDDGGAVFFQTGDPLVPGDVNGTVDVYEWREGQISLISSGHSSAPSYLYGMTPEGHDVFFRTREALLPQDHTAAAGAIYDARIGGGFPAETATQPCVEDACQGSPSPPPALPAAGSAGFQGSGNPTPHRPKAHRCGKGKRQVQRHGQVRCVKKHRRRASNSHRGAQ